MLKNKLLAVVTALALILTSLSGTMIFVSAQETDVEDLWDYGATVGAVMLTQSGNTGVATFGGDNAMAVMNKAVNILDNMVCFKITPPQNAESSGWAILQLAPDKGYGGNILWNSESVGANGGLPLFFDYQPDSQYMRMWIYTDGWENPTITTIDNFNWNATHTVSIVQEGSAYYVALDNVVYRNANVAPWVEKLDLQSIYVRWATYVADLIIESTINTKVWDYDATVGAVTMTQSGCTGVATFGGGDAMVAMYKPINLLEDSVCFEMTPPQNAGEGWAILQLAPDKGYGGSILWNSESVGANGGLPLFFTFKPNSQSVQMWIYTGGWENTTIVTLANFNWSATHTVRLIQEGSAYYVELDNIIYRNANVAPWVEKLDLQSTYVRWAANMADLTVETSVNTEVEGFWITDSDNVSVTGNNTDGYSFSGNVMAGYTQPIDLEKQELTVKANPDNWMGVRFTDNYTAMGVENRYNYSTGITFFVQRWNDEAGNVLKLWHMGDGNENVILLTSDFDWDAPHTYGLEKEDDRWYLRLDGVTLKSIDLTDMVEEMLGRGRVFAQITCQPEGGNISVSEMKISDSISVKPGDLNGDGKSNANDLILLKKSLLTDGEEYDVNKDDAFNILDLICLKKMLLV